ncbi:hypothetical protein HZB89_01385 [archaeon]|nr:hypothetical protein [archaeon]
MARAFLKGQASIEFLLIIVIMIVFIQTIVQPAVLASADALEDVRQVGETKAAAQKLVNALDELSLAGDNAVKTIFIFVPGNSVIECSQLDSRIVYAASLKSEATACQPPAESIQPIDNDNQKCTYAIQSIAGIQCNTTVFEGLLKGQAFEVRLSKAAGVVNVG